MLSNRKHGEHMFDLKFKDNWLSELGGVVEEQKKRKFALPNIELIDIPGRSKKVVKDNLSYDSIELEEQVAFLPTLCKLNIAELGKRLSEWLIGTEYSQLYMDYMEGYFYNSIVTDISDLQVGNAGVMRTTIKFTCEPFLYSYEGQKAIDVSSATLSVPITIYNPEKEISYPKILISVEGENKTIIFYANKRTFTVKDITGSAIIDTENRNCVMNNTIHNECVNGVYFPTFSPGLNSISVQASSGTTVKVVPNWRRL